MPEFPFRRLIRLVSTAMCRRSQSKSAVAHRQKTRCLACPPDSEPLRAALIAALKSGDSAVALRLLDSDRDVPATPASRGPAISLLILALLTLVALFTFQGNVAPLIASLDQQSAVGSDDSSQFAPLALATVAAIFVVVLLTIGGWIVGSLRRRDRPWAVPSRDTLAATTAGHITAATAAGMSPEEAVKFATVASPRAANPSSAHKDIGELPPLLAHVLFNDASGERLPAELAALADFYRQREEAYRPRQSKRFAIIASTLGGGLIVLLYGLTLFVPVTQLLNRLAQ